MVGVAGSGPMKDFPSDPEVQDKFIKEYFKPWQAALLDSAGSRVAMFLQAVGLGESGTRLNRDDNRDAAGDPRR